jgi:hypothetical protein
MTLEPVGNGLLCVHQHITGQSNDSFIWPATGRRRQSGDGGIRDVYADYRKVAIVEFPNVRTAGTRGCLRAVFMRIRADSADKCDHFVSLSKHFTLLRKRSK